MQAIHSAISELTVPLLGSTFTPIVVFLPLIAITGVTGTFFRALAITMAAALATSLVLALLWTPNLSRFLCAAREERHAPVKSKPFPQRGTGRPFADVREEEVRKLMAAEEASMSGFFSRVITFYEGWVRRALEHPLWLAGLCGSSWSHPTSVIRALGSDLLPSMDEGGFVLDYITPPGSSLEETNRAINHILKLVHALPEVDSTSRRTGLQLGLAAVTEANTGDISIKLKEKRDRNVWEIMNQVRQEIARQEPAVDVEFTQSYRT